MSMREIRLRAINVLEWISNWPTQRAQKVVLNGEALKEVKVISGVPQGTVLGPPLMLAM